MFSVLGMLIGLLSLIVICFQIHENYLTRPTFVNDVGEWQRRYEKMRADFDYTLAILAPDDSASSSTISARQRASAALKSQAERRFADLKSAANFDAVDNRAAWLTYGCLLKSQKFKIFFYY